MVKKVMPANLPATAMDFLDFLDFLDTQIWPDLRREALTCGSSKGCVISLQ